MAAPMKTHMRVLTAWKSVKPESFCQHPVVKIQRYKNSYGFELMIVEIGVRLEVDYNICL